MACGSVPSSYTEPLGSEERSKLRRVRVRRVRSDNAFWSRGTPKTDYAVQLGADATDASASGDRQGTGSAVCCYMERRLYEDFPMTARSGDTGGLRSSRVKDRIDTRTQT